MPILLPTNKVIILGVFLFSLLLLGACSSSKMPSERIVSSQLDNSGVNLTAELSKLSRVNVSGYGRIAKIRLSNGCKPTFLLNGQLEHDYRQIYDIVERSTLKTLRIQNLSDAARFGLRPGGSSLIVIETE